MCSVPFAASTGAHLGTELPKLIGSGELQRPGEACTGEGYQV